MEKLQKNIRTLSIYVRLCDGKVINKAQEAHNFGVDERSIQRDIDDIRAFFDEQYMLYGYDNRKIVYNRSKKGFIMTGFKTSLMDNSEILAVSKILLESRAFSRDEMTEILDKLISGCVPYDNKNVVSDLIANEKYHYVELNHPSFMRDVLWDLGVDINQHNILKIQYKKQVSKEETVERIIEPVAIMFSEYYFYLNAYILTKQEDGTFTHKYDYPAIFRLDRIDSYKKTDITYNGSYASRFEDGRFRKRVQFMFAGELTTIQFRYTGQNAEPILDRLPTARIISHKEDGFIIEAEVYGKGILMWILSQGEKVEVLKPLSLRDEIREKIFNMFRNYND